MIEIIAYAEHLGDLLKEFVLSEDAGYSDTDEAGIQYCKYCGHIHEFDGENYKRNYPHDKDCLISRARRSISLE